MEGRAVRNLEAPLFKVRRQELQRLKSTRDSGRGPRRVLAVEAKGQEDFAVMRILVALCA